MTITQKSLIGSGILLAAIALFSLFMARQSFGSAPTGLQTALATSSTLQTGPNYVQVLTIPYVNCTSRAISTANTAIRLSFGGISATSTATSSAQIGAGVGLWQAASTTVLYDGGQYGCGYVGVIGQDLSTSTVTVEVFN